MTLQQPALRKSRNVWPVGGRDRPAERTLKWPMRHWIQSRGSAPSESHGSAYPCGPIASRRVPRRRGPAPESSARSQRLRPNIGRSRPLRLHHGFALDEARSATHDAQETIYFANRVVEPSNDYIYDALYLWVVRILTTHTGRCDSAGAHDRQATGGR